MKIINVGNYFSVYVPFKVVPNKNGVLVDKNNEKTEYYLFVIRAWPFSWHTILH